MSTQTVATVFVLNDPRFHHTVNLTTKYTRPSPYPDGGAENAEPENLRQSDSGGKCRTGKLSTRKCKTGPRRIEFEGKGKGKRRFV